MRRSMVTLALIALPFLASVSQAQGRPDQRDDKSEKEKSAKCEKGPSENANPMAREKGAGQQEDKGKHKGSEKRCSSSGEGTDPQPEPQPEPQPDPAPSPAPAGMAEIRGLVFVDLDGSNAFEAGEPAVAGWVINLTGPVSASMPTDGFGNFAFTALPPGTYQVCAQAVPGFTPVVPASGPGCPDGFGFSLTVPTSLPAQVFSNVNFGYKM